MPGRKKKVAPVALGGQDEKSLRSPLERGHVTFVELMLRKGSRCSMCHSDVDGRLLYEEGRDRAFHLYPDGSLMGPCFHPRMARAIILVMLGKLDG